ncbi:MAG: CPBP family intramembrane glutamic endopeptidase [Myxococcales bacterium]|jgi:membrane protease YdiL (CAAX protease family)
MAGPASSRARSAAARPPLPILLAFCWTVFITAALWLGLSLVFVNFRRGAPDIVLLGLTQVVVYAIVLALFGFSARTPARDLLALRPASLKVVLAAAALGAILQIPATLMSNAVERFYPLPPEELAERMARITPHSTAHAVAIFAVVALLGPCVEEFFFRGALFGALRRGNGALVTSAVVSLCFALGHLDLRLLLPLLVAAFAIADVREHTGSIWPGLALHAAFNGATLAIVFAGDAPAGKPPPMPALFALSGCALSFALLVLVRTLALSSALAQNARRSDVP